MSEAVNTTEIRQRKLPYRGRDGQAIIYIGKFLRMFVYQADWKVLPMAALIAGVVSMVVRRDFFLTMEGTLKGALALTCLSIWNGCFNSIQVVCREREIIKREHRAGMHISAYIFAHMVYQGLLCLLQTAVTLYVCKITGIQFPSEGLFTPWLIADLGITIFLVTYASDMLALWVSCVTRSTTTAMTVMPFILIFQLVFSGGVFSLPAWANKLAVLSVSNYGMKCVAAQSKYNDLPLVTGWNSLVKVENQEINTTITLGEVIDFLSNDSNVMVHDIRENEITLPSVNDILGFIGQSGNTTPIIDGGPSLPELVGKIKESFTPETTEITTQRPTVKVGDVVDYISASEDFQAYRGESYKLSTTVKQIMEMVGRDKMETYVKEQTRLANFTPAYETTKENIGYYWYRISLFVVLFSVLAVIFLEFVDKDKR